MIQIARAKASSTSGNDAEVSVFLNNALKITSARYSSSSQKSISNLNSEDAAYINREAAYMFAQMGNDKEFQDRDSTARFYAMSEQEKFDYKAGDVISITPTGPAAVETPRPLTANQKDLNELNARNAQRLAQEAEIDQGKQIIETADPEAADSGLMTLNTKSSVETKVWNRKDGKKPPSQSRPNIYTRGTIINQPINSLNKANTVGNGLALVLEGLKWRTFWVRMQEITEYLNKRDALLREIQNEMTRVVPDKPRVIEKAISQIRNDARTTTDPEKRQAQILIDRLGLMLEQSYAFYGKQ